VLHAARWKYRTQKNRQKFAIWAPSHNFFGLYFGNYGTTDNRKKLIKEQYIRHVSSQYGELRPINGWDRCGSLGHLDKFQRVSRLGVVTAPTSLNGSQSNFEWCLAVFWVGTLYIGFSLGGLLPANGISPGAKFTSRPSLVFSYISPILAALLHGTRAVGVSQTL